MNEQSDKGYRAPVLWVAYGVALILWLMCSWLITGSIFTSRSNVLIREKSQLVQQRIDNAVEAVAHDLDEVHGIPALVAHDREVMRVLSQFGATKSSFASSDEQSRAMLRGNRQLDLTNNYLKLVTGLLGTDVLYIINTQGTCIASSNYDKPDSFVGANFADREYFRVALSGYQGHQYARGKVSKIAGLYFSVPVTVEGSTIGVAVAKVNISRLSHWVRQENTFISDNYGVIILASDANMNMRSTPGAPVFNLPKDEQLARYGSGTFPPLSISPWPAEFIEPLFRFDQEDVPTLVTDRALVDDRIRVSAYRRFPEIAEYSRDRLNQFLLLGISGMLAIFFVAARLAITRISKKANEEQRIAATAFETDEGIMITNREGKILRVNRAFTRLTGYTAEEVIGRTPALLRSGRQDQAFYRKMWETLAREKYWKGEIWNRRNNGEIYPEWLTITAVSNSRGMVTHYVGVFSDITERKFAEQKISFLAYHDKLTGLPNRSLFYDRMSRAMSQTRRMDRHFALLLLDLDGFKAVNDEFGHASGDEVIKASAQRLLACVRDVDTVARMGGDEFAIILSEVKSSEDIGAIAKKIIQRISVPVSLLEGKTCSVGVSIGIAIHPDDGAEIDRLIRAADAAMYESKAAGRRTYTFAKHERDENAAKRPWITLDDAYLLGVPEIDEQHLDLVDQLNELNLMIRNIASSEVILKAFDNLVASVGGHFDDEERLMEMSGFDKAMHQQEHQNLLSEAGAMREQLVNDGEAVVLQTLKTWLMNHVLNSDRKFASFYKEYKTGQMV